MCLYNISNVFVQIYKKGSNQLIAPLKKDSLKNYNNKSTISDACRDALAE